MSDTTQHAYRTGTDEIVLPGALVESFRGETWTFEGIAREAHGNSSGRVRVSAACEGSNGLHCTHMWHRDGIEVREVFPSVFDLYLATEKSE